MPSQPHMAVHLLNAGNALGPHVDDLRDCLESTAARVQPLLALHAVDVVVYHDPPFTIPELGAGGYTPSAHRVFMPIDVQRYGSNPTALNTH